MERMRSMVRFIIDSQVFEKLPDACFGIVAARGIDNSRRAESITQMLREQEESFKARKAEVNLKEDGDILPYREAFYALGMNPNKFMCSIEALGKRVQKGHALPEINSIVDLGNAFSLKYVLPMGAHDIGKLDGDLEVRFSVEEDTFLPLGETEAEKPGAGELVYVSSHTVKTRRWIWRQSDDGKITEDTKDVFFPIDGFLGKNDGKILAARDELAKFIEKEFGCKAEFDFLTAEHNVFEF